MGHVGGDDELDQMQALLDGYRASLTDEVAHLLDRFTLEDAARKVVGVGSVGTRCWIVLLEGGGHDDPLILQIKEAQESVLEPYLGRSAYDNHARRAVEGQRFMQAASDMFLGWTHDETSGVDYYWRNLRDMKVSANVNALSTNTFLSYAELCGGTLARAHARSGDAAGISGYLGKGDAFGKALGRFADLVRRSERSRPRRARAGDQGRPSAGRGERVRRPATPMDYSRLSMPLGEAIFTQRSIRRFKPDPIPLADVQLILEAASKAPNGGNQQVARFLVVNDRGAIREFGALYHEAWWAKRRDEGFQQSGGPPTRFHAAAGLADAMTDVPCIVFALALP